MPDASMQPGYSDIRAQVAHGEEKGQRPNFARRVCPTRYNTRMSHSVVYGS